jgi:uncharacterized protein (TIGR02246 family)
MRRFILCGFIILAATVTARLVVGQAPAAKRGAEKSAPKASPGNTGPSADERAIRQTATTFADAYNKHDAKAIAALFTPDGQLVDETGDVVQGREKVEGVFAAVFQEYPEATTSVNVRSVRFLSPSIAEEDGATSVIHEPGMAPETGRYVVVHVKRDGKWLMASARDLSQDASAPAAELQPLAGLVGDWIDESPDSLIRTSYMWTDNQAFILGEFTIHVAGRPVMTGSQRIGWDPLAKVIRSWVFDSEGGFAEGVYSREGDRWVIKLSGVTREGEAATATNIITFVGKDRMTWESRDRTVGGRATPDIEVVTMVRPPPSPE